MDTNLVFLLEELKTRSGVIWGNYAGNPNANPTPASTNAPVRISWLIDESSNPPSMWLKKSDGVWASIGTDIASSIAAANQILSATQQVLDDAQAARDATYSAAQSSGVYIYDTKALANAAVAGLADLSIVEVLADESQSGARTRYRKESGSLVFKIALEQFLQAGAGAVARTVQGKLRDVVSVKDFGASGDGVADDTAEIQAAINYCQSSKCALYFPAGTYNISANLVIPLSGTGQTNAQKFRMFGAGKQRDTSMIKAVNVGVTKIVQCSSTAGNNDFLLEIDRLCLNGNSIAQYGVHGIAIQHLSMNYCWVQGCTEAGFYGTGSISGGYCNEFRDSTFYQNKIGMVLGGAVNQTLLDHCKFWGNEIGLDLITTQAVKLDNSMFESNTVVGARILGNAVTFDTCYFENNSTVGIVFTTPSTTVKADIYIKGGSGNSILEISSPSKSVAIRNCFTQVGDSANGCFVFAAAATGLVLEGNNCKSNAQAPLLRTYFNGSYSFLRNVRALSNTDFSKQIDLLAYSTSVLLSAARLLNWFRSDTAQLRNYANAELNEWTFNSVFGGSGGTWSRSAQKYRGDVPVWELANPATSLSYYARFTLSAADFPENIGKFFSFVLPMKASGAGAIVTFTSTAFAAQASIATDWEHRASIFEWPASGTLTFGFAFSGLAGSVHVATPMLYEIGADAESLASDFGVQRTFYGTAAPTAGTWKRGDVVLNNAPSAAGVPGWVCVTAGAPGTWKAMAVVAS